MKYSIKRPHITEKSLRLAGRGWYTFVVDEDANKEQIASQIHQLFGVDVTSVRTIKMAGKIRRVGRKMREVRRSDWKKAMVQLKSGQHLDIFENAPQEGKQS